jgi:GT2 family glycosyltransferase
MMKKSTAILITCYNRYEKTARCIQKIKNIAKPEQRSFDIYLVDDASPDNTGSLIKENHPDVHIIRGTGDLYWAGGMRLAWSQASKHKNYDFYIWLNDDTELFHEGLVSIFIEYNQILNQKNKEVVIVGSIKDSATGEFAYGGRLGNLKIIPDGSPQHCDYINGNVVLVPKRIFLEVGSLDKRFSHGIADFDYGLMALKKGFPVLASSHYIGECFHDKNSRWINKNDSFKKRYNLLISKTGGNIFEYLYFVKKHRGIIRMILSSLNTILTLFFPAVRNTNNLSTK